MYSILIVGIVLALVGIVLLVLRTRPRKIGVVFATLGMVLIGVGLLLKKSLHDKR